MRLVETHPFSHAARRTGMTTAKRGHALCRVREFAVTLITGADDAETGGPSQARGCTPRWPDLGRRCRIREIPHSGHMPAFFLGVEAWVLTMLVPYFIAMAFGSYLFYAQHNFPSVTFSDNAGWT